MARHPCVDDAHDYRVRDRRRGRAKSFGCPLGRGWRCRDRLADHHPRFGYRCGLILLVDQRILCSSADRCGRNFTADLFGRRVENPVVTGASDQLSGSIALRPLHIPKTPRYQAPQSRR